MKHPKTLYGKRPRTIGKAIAKLDYKSLALLLDEISATMFLDAKIDSKKQRNRLADLGCKAMTELYNAATTVFKMADIKPKK